MIETVDWVPAFKVAGPLTTLVRENYEVFGAFDQRIIRIGMTTMAWVLLAAKLAVSVPGTVKSEPLLAVPLFTANATSIGVTAGLLKVNVTVALPAPSLTTTLLERTLGLSHHYLGY